MMFWLVVSTPLKDVKVSWDDDISHFQCMESHNPAMFQITNQCLIWVCLKIGYIPNYSHLVGIMIINHGV